MYNGVQIVYNIAGCDVQIVRSNEMHEKRLTEPSCCDILI